MLGARRIHFLPQLPASIYAVREDSALSAPKLLPLGGRPVHPALSETEVDVTGSVAAREERKNLEFLMA
jgi:hypothetical protein